MCLCQPLDCLYALNREWTLELTHKGVSFTKQISSPVSVCDVMTYMQYHTKIKGKGKAVNVLIALATGLYLCPEQEWTLCKRWVAES